MSFSELYLFLSKGQTHLLPEGTSCSVRGCKNSILEAVYNAFSNLMLKSRQRTNQIPGVAESSLKDHQEIFLAVKSGNAKQAYRYMLIHMNKTERNMKMIFGENSLER